ncbi:MAG: hypothetical protein WCV67_01690 [Victivallaceae bacterium]|jgi:hypothetical protein
MKLLACCLIAFCMISTVSARDITTLDGATYKNVIITNSSPVGITIAYEKPDGATVIKGLDFRDLPEDIRKEFGYTEIRAAEFEKHAREYQNMLYKDALKRASANAAVEQRDEELSKQIDHIQAFLFSKRKYVRFTAIRPHANGAVGYAEAADRTLLYGEYGNIFVKGLNGTQGTRWSGYIYPTDETITTSDGSFAVYNSSLAQATAEAMQALKQ